MRREDIDAIADKYDLPAFERRRPHREMSRSPHSSRHRSCTDKLRFHSEEQAHDYLKRIKSRMVKRGIQERFDPQRIYECHICNGYHTTHYIIDKDCKSMTPDPDYDDEKLLWMNKLNDRSVGAWLRANGSIFIAWLEGTTGGTVENPDADEVSAWDAWMLNGGDRPERRET